MNLKINDEQLVKYAAIGTACIVLLALIFDIYPKFRTLKQVKAAQKAKVARLKAQAPSQQERKRRKQALEKELMEISDSLREVRRAAADVRANITEEENMPLITLEIEDLATEAGIELISVKPEDAQISEGYEVIPIAIKCQGEYEAIIKFVDKIEESSSLSAIEKISVAFNEDMYPKLDIELTPWVLNLKEAEEPSVLGELKELK